MLDEDSVLGRHNILTALESALKQIDQLNLNINILNKDNDCRRINNIVFIGSGQSVITGFIARTWLVGDLKIPFEVILAGSLPSYVGIDSLVIACDYDGNDVLSAECVRQALGRGAQIAVISSGGDMIEIALANDITYIPLLISFSKQPTVLYEMKALALILDHFNIISIEKIIQLVNSFDLLKKEAINWTKDIFIKDNLAKQIANLMVGKNAIFYSGLISCVVANKFVTDLSIYSNNIAFSGIYSDFGDIESGSWLSHPIEKPFIVFNIVSDFESKTLLDKALSIDRLLSGKRPKSNGINLIGENLIEQLLYGVVLSSFVSIYLAALNNVNPLKKLHLTI